jgi:tetratricopeptide (TPR) repeat protein
MALRRRYVVLLLLFLTLGVYYPAIFAESISIDDPHIISSYIDTEKFDIWGLFIPSRGGYYYRPLLGLTFIADKVFWGMHESFMHLENVILHSLNVVLVFVITTMVSRRYSITSIILPLVAAVLFAVHPITTESVNWIAGRTDLLAGFFLLASVVLILYSLEQSSQFYGFIGVAVFFLACMSKEVVVAALPGLFILVVFYDQNGSFWDKLRSRWASAGSLLASVLFFLFLMVMILLNTRGESGITRLYSIVSKSGIDSFISLQLAVTALGFYAKKFFIPWPLNFAIVKVSAYYVIPGVLLLFVVLYILRNRSLLSALSLTGLFLIFPALLISVARMTWTPLAERYLYIPSAFFCITIPVAVYRYIFLENKSAGKLLPAVLIIVVSVSTYTTIQRNLLWQNNINLLQDTLKKSPDFYLVQNALAYSLGQKGRIDEWKNMMMSIKVPEGSKDGGKVIDSNQAMILAGQGKFIEAKQLLLRNIENAGSLYPIILENLVTVDRGLLGKEKDKKNSALLQKEIMGHFQKLYEITENPFYYYRAGQFLLGIGNKPQAKTCFSKAYLLSPEGTHYKMAAKKLSENLP